MNKESVIQFVTTSITLTATIFILEVLFEDVAFQFKNIMPYLVSTLIGMGAGTIYFRFIGFRFTKFQFLSCVIPAVLFNLLITKSSLHHYLILHDLTITVAFMLVVFNSLEFKRK